MAKVVGVDHLSISVKDFKVSKKFYGEVLKFLGFKVLDEYEDPNGLEFEGMWYGKRPQKNQAHALIHRFQ